MSDSPESEHQGGVDLVRIENAVREALENGSLGSR